MLNLNDLFNQGIFEIADTAKRFYTHNRAGMGFLLRLVPLLRRSALARKRYELDGVQIPPFLIASVSSSCNLHCKGCYARANGGCGNDERQEEMSLEDWRSVFSQAVEMGVSFVMLAGGEPLLRRDVIELASQFDSLVFPIFTNGTLLSDEYLSLLANHRHLIPVISIEGSDARTDARRGEEVSKRIQETASELRERGILFGASITVTSDNWMEVTEGRFLSELQKNGYGLVFYVEYVPAQENTDHLILHDDELRELAARIDRLRQDQQNRGMILLSFPGDEEALGGCLAAGRGFFHINANGGAEPCPFSPYSELNVKKHSLLTILRSPFFKQIRKISATQAGNHLGGCTLFQHRQEVQQAMREG